MSRSLQDTSIEVHEGGWVEVALRRPEKSNAIREQTAAELLSHLESAEAEPSCRAIVLHGEGGSFCAGVDTSEQQLAPDETFELWRRRKRSRRINQFFRGLPEVTKPVIAAVEGHALGGGFELALLCDLVVAAEDARFGLPECGLGIMPGGGGTQTLARVLGKPLTKEILWTGRKLGGREAFEMRLANHVVPPGQALEKARELARAVASRAPLSVMFTKQAVERGCDVPLREGMAIEADAFFALAFSRDKAEGLAALRERRKPRFAGR